MIIPYFTKYFYSKIKITGMQDKQVSEFIKKNSLEKRIAISKKIFTDYPHCVPVLVSFCQMGPQNLDKFKYLVSRDITVANFLVEIRKNTKNISENEALFLILPNDMLPLASEYVHGLYYKYKDKDNFLYVNVFTENTFG